MEARRPPVAQTPARFRLLTRVSPFAVISVHSPLKTLRQLRAKSHRHFRPPPAPFFTPDFFVDFESFLKSPVFNAVI